MYLAIFDKPAPIFGIHNPGEYLLENINAGEALIHEVAHVEMMLPGVRGKRSENSHILISRSGGYGDLLMLAPILTKLQSMNVHTIGVCCHDRYRDALPPGIIHHSYPMPLEDARAYSTRYDLERVIENTRSEHPIDVMAAMLEVTLADEEKVANLEVPAKLQLWARYKYPRLTGKRRVGIQIEAGAECRTFPRDCMREVIDLLLRKDWQVYLFASPQHPPIKNLPSMCVDVTGGKPDFTFMETCAVMQTCDVMLTPDSGLCHAAGSMRIPAVALFGSFPWMIRTKYYPTVRALSGNLACAPCFHDPKTGVWPVNGPCRSTERCEALAQIAPKRICSMVERMAKGDK